MRIKLPKRLAAIADFINEGAAVADIGTDHGFLPVYLALTNQVRRIIASDKSIGSLESARRSALRYSVTDKIEFVCTPGLDHLAESDVDTVVIAGVGGETILGILEDAPWVQNVCTNGKLKLILQPQTKTEVLRGFLHDNGYEIKEEKLVIDRGRRYTIMVVQGSRFRGQGIRGQ